LDIRSLRSLVFMGCGALRTRSAALSARTLQWELKLYTNNFARLLSERTTGLTQLILERFPA